MLSNPSLTYRRIPVNNAGYVLGVEHAGDIADADIEGMFATNVLGLISVTQLLVKGTSVEILHWNLYTDNRTRFQSQEVRPCNQHWLPGWP